MLSESYTYNHLKLLTILGLNIFIGFRRDSLRFHRIKLVKAKSILLTPPNVLGVSI